ncbi:MAG: MmgE/PrpD family protein [Gaiellaceae bacterium]
MSEAGGRYAEAVGRLAQSVATVSWDELSSEVRERVLLVLFDTLGVAAAGAATPELVSLTAAWDPPAGEVPLIAAGRSSDEATACVLNGAATCTLELDEGNKYARGHPCAHVLPAALALGATSECSGAEWLSAFSVGYEVAARFGRATRLKPGVHPHGTWGAPGAAVAAGRLLRLGAEELAGAIDAASAQSVAPHFSSAFRGSFVRNVWIGQANLAGLTAARLAQSGLASVDGAAPDVYGEILGTLDVSELDRDLGSCSEVLRGYFKRHAACAYTHAPADAVQELLTVGAIDPEAVTEILVETYGIAATLDTREWPTRLAAMFSIPYVVAETVRAGEFGPRSTDEERRADSATVALAERVSVQATDEFERRLPDNRGARVTVTTDEGSRSAEIRNPIGDADNQPLGWDDVRVKVSGLVGETASAELEALVRAMPDATSAASGITALARVKVAR